jgi:hypothetical protein
MAKTKVGVRGRKRFTAAQKVKVVKRIKLAVKAGVTLTQACLDAGITAQKYKVWNLGVGKGATRAIAKKAVASPRFITVDAGAFALAKEVLKADVGADRKLAVVEGLLF